MQCKTQLAAHDVKDEDLPWVSAHDLTPLVLICDPEHGYIDELLAHLALGDMRTVYTSDGRTALRLHAALKPDLILVEVRIPILNGWEVLERIRERSGTPIIMLTAQSTEADKLHGLRSGADDYICKPFSAAEVVARIEAVLRRAQFKGNLPRRGVLRVHPFEIDLLNMEISLLRDRHHRENLDLTPSEFKLLRQLLLAPGRLHRRSELQVCLSDGSGPSRKVDIYISRVRRKLEQAGAGAVLKTVRKEGYGFYPAGLTPHPVGT